MEINQKKLDETEITNLDVACEFVGGMCGFQINKLIWIATSLGEAGKRNLVNIFNTININSGWLTDVFSLDEGEPSPYEDDLGKEYFPPEFVIELLEEYARYGFFAEILVSFPSDIIWSSDFDEASIKTYEHSKEEVFYVYGESLNEILYKMKIKAEMFWNNVNDGI